MKGQRIQMLDNPNETNSGIVFNIQRMSIHDGPGIRSTVFLKGCPLKCLWCSNPESQSPELEIACFKNRCIQCGDCAVVCPEGIIEHGGDFRILDRSKCTMCLKCVDICSTNAKSVIGKEYAKEELLEEILKDKTFYDSSGGGVTFSGGEPLMQAAFLIKMLELCQSNGIHTAVETSGMGSERDLLQALEHLDLVFFDIKHMDAEKHMELTAVSNKLILENLASASKQHSNIIVRIPIIPGLNDSVENIRATADYVASLNIATLELLPYHPLGEIKYEQLGTEYLLADVKEPSEEHMKKLVAEACSVIGTRATKVQLM